MSSTRKSVRTMLTDATRMVSSTADAVCNGTEAVAHVLGAGKIHARTMEEGAEASASLAAMENIQRVAERMADIQSFEENNAEACQKARAFLAQVAENRRQGRSPYEATISSE